MIEAPPIARVANAIGEPARAAMLVALMDGRALTVTELANAAGVTRQTASAHVSRLHDEHLVRREKQGRHHYIALASPAVADLLEQLMGISVVDNCKPVRTGPTSPGLRYARVCYDHLAGELGVALFDGLRKQGLITVEDSLDTPQVRLPDEGLAAFRSLGVDLRLLDVRRRPACRACLDWSMRRHHLAGSLGQALLDHVFAKGWAQRLPDSRAITFSARGERAFGRAFL